ncbi:MAG: phosphoribosylformylglycinamidine cyclo-ligase [Capsulimonadaceae bacterium]|nr:phosphoribosylformylglycinamidine cyclo-ligase [Capsulimonadaceae bacterium]
MTNHTRDAYAEAGVDIAAADDAVQRMKKHIASTRVPGVLTSEVGSFGGMFALRDGERSGASIPDPVLVSSIDGVGTKLKVAFLTGRHDTIGKDLVSHCVNDILVQGARPLFFLDYFATGKLSPEVAEAVVKGLSEGCVETGCVLIGGETAEMPGMYDPQEYDLAGCIIGIVDRSKIIDGRKVKEGDVLLGLKSDGLHTNGYSLARKVLLYDSGWSVKTVLPDVGVTVGEALLWPHRCYLRPLDKLLNLDIVNAMAHITGGGLTDNIPRTLPAGLGVQIDRSSWTVPPIYELIQHMGGIPDSQMLHAFNMGIGFVAIVSAGDADAAAIHLTAAGETVYRIGEVVKGTGVSYR